MAAHTELKRGSAELMVLAAIEERARHGYDIARVIDDRSNGVLRFHVASLYPMLYRMEKRGWIDGAWVEKAGQRRRRYYGLTADGRKSPRVAAKRLARPPHGAASRRRPGPARIGRPLGITLVRIRARSDKTLGRIRRPRIRRWTCTTTFVAVWPRILPAERTIAMSIRR